VTIEPEDKTTAPVVIQEEQPPPSPETQTPTSETPPYSPLPLKLSTTNLTFEAQGKTHALFVTSRPTENELKYQVSGEFIKMPPRLSPSPQDGSGYISLWNMTVTTIPNPSLEERKGTVTFALGNETVLLNVTQKGMSNPKLSITNLTFDAKGGKKNVDIESGITNFLVKVSDSFITLDVGDIKKQDGIFTRTVKVTVSKNDKREEHQGNVMFIVGNVTNTLVVTQKPAPLPLSFTLSSMDDLTFEANGGTIVINVESGITTNKFSTQKSGDFITLHPLAPSQKENDDKMRGAVRVTVPKYNDPKERKGTVTVILGNEDVTLNVIQEGAPPKEEEADKN